MSRSHSAVASVAVLCLLPLSSVSAADKKPAAARPHYATGQAAIEKALAAPIDLDFTDTPLEEVLDFVKDFCRIEVVLDAKALGECGIDASTPVTKKLHNLPLRSALNLTLREHGLTWTIQDDVLLITTPGDAGSYVYAKVYDVSDLVVCRGQHDELWDDYETLIDAVKTTIDPTTWDDIGGPGSTSGASLGKAKVLIVLQTYDVHCRVAELLARIRDAAKKNSDGQLPRRNKPAAKPQTLGLGPTIGDPNLLPAARSKPVPETRQGPPAKEARPGAAASPPPCCPGTPGVPPGGVIPGGPVPGRPNPPPPDDDSRNPFEPAK